MNTSQLCMEKFCGNSVDKTSPELKTDASEIRTVIKWVPMVSTVK